jgi:hypothetical protein
MAEGLAHPEFQRQGVASRLVWGSFRRSDIWITRGKGGPRFRFAAGALAEVKGDAERLRHNPKEHGLVMGLLAVHPCVEWADAVSGVANGMNEDAEEIGDRTGKPVVRMYRPKGAISRYDIRYVSKEDQSLAREVEKLCFLEDLTSTGSTPWHQGRIIRADNPGVTIHALSEMHRGPINPKYEEGPDGMTFHTLCIPSEPIPLDYDRFVEAFGIEPTLVPVGE